MREHNLADQLMVHSEFTGLRRATSPDARLLRTLREITRIMRSMHRRPASSDVGRQKSVNSECTINMEEKDTFVLRVFLFAQI